MFFKSRLGNIYYELYGPENAPVIIFTHGVGLNSKYFNSQAISLKDKYRVLVWDMLGHGDSALLDKNLNIEDMVDIIIEMMEDNGIEKAVMVGHSFGSWVSQLAAIYHPDKVSAVVSIGGVPINKPMRSLELMGYKIIMRISKIIPFRYVVNFIAKNKAVTPEAQLFAEEACTSMGKEQLFLTISGMLDAGKLGIDKPFHQPLLIAHGTHEMPKYVAKVCKEWHNEVKGSYYADIPKAGHNANQDNPQDFNQALISFLMDYAESI